MREVDAAEIDEDEEAALLAERERLRHAEGLAAAASAAAEALSPSDGEGGAVGALGVAAAALAPMVDVDEALRAPHAELAAAQEALQESGMSLRAYLDDLDAEPGRLAQLEDRLDVYARLSRRYGPGTALVLERAARARESLRGAGRGRRRGARPGAGARERHERRGRRSRSACAPRASRPRRGSPTRCATSWPTSRWRAPSCAWS